MDNTSPVLIVGAGPTGLVLALFLAKMGIRARIIDKTSVPGTTSRALAVHARTLEFYQQIGIDQDIISGGLIATGINLWIKGESRARFDVSEIGAGLSPYPYILFLQQDKHEEILIQKLLDIGIKVERETELVNFTEDKTGITARLRKNNYEETSRYTYIAGCDGARSRVREIIGTGFPGGTYAHIFYVADVLASGGPINGEINVAIDDDDFVIIFPLKGEKKARVIGALKKDLVQTENLDWDDVAHIPIDRLKLSVEKINWFSTYHVHHRVSTHLQKGRAFILGDAAHIHSPVGGQGMNTGIGDAVNLAWKLAMVLKNSANPHLLDTYEVERKAFAKRLVNTTDQAFKFVTSRGFIANFIRLNIVPRILPPLLNTNFMKRLQFQTVSQTGIHYHMSRLSQGSAGISGGDRLPWVKLKNESDNFAVLKEMNWQLHIYGEAKFNYTEVCAQNKISLHQFSWEESLAKAGLSKDAVYLIRPDGYVAICGKKLNPDALKKYFIEIF